MKTFKYYKNVLRYLALSLVFTACSDDDNPAPTPPPEETGTSAYVMSFQAIGADNATVDFLLDVPTVKSLQSGVLSVEGQGIPQVGWRFAEQAANSVFTIGFSDDNKAIAYQLNDQGEVAEAANVVFENNLDKTISRINENTLLVADLVRSVSVSENNIPSIPELIFTTINGQTGQAEKIVTAAIDNQLDLQNDPENPINLDTSYLPWITGMELNAGKLYVSYQKLAVDGSFRLIDASKAYVAVLNYPDLTVDTLIEDGRANSIGVNSQTGLHKAEDNTLYSFSSSASKAMGLFGEMNNPAGILRILPGSKNFDESYFFDVENAPNGGKLFWMDYIGNYKAIARILVEENASAIGDWGAFSEQGNFFRLVILDLAAQTITNVDGMPLHANRYTANTYVEDGKAYISARVGESTAIGSVSGSGETHIYIIDPESATATQGAEIDGVAVKGIFKISSE